MIVNVKKFSGEQGFTFYGLVPSHHLILRMSHTVHSAHTDPVRITVYETKNRPKVVAGDLWEKYIINYRPNCRLQQKMYVFMNKGIVKEKHDYVYFM